MKKISVLISVYNKENYLARCLDSICLQTMPPEDVEIICVDDKSTDHSLEILHEYREKYPNITVIEREVNSGAPGLPRNEALEMATGKYVFFVDSDDFIGIEALERLYNFAEENNSDTLLCKMKGVGGRGVPRSMFHKNEANVDLANSRIIFTLTSLKLFRRSLLIDNNIKFHPEYRSGEDQPFVMKAYLESDVISTLSDYDYYYAVKPTGVHMSGVYEPPKIFYACIGEVFRSIDNSKLSSAKKDKVRAIFINRHFDFSRTKNFTINYASKKEEWMHYLREMVLNYIPEHVDDMVKPHIKIKLKLIRNNYLENLSKYTLEERKQSFKTRIVHGEIIGEYESLKDYDFPLKDLIVTYKNRLTHFLSITSIQDLEFVMEGYAQHLILNYDYNKKQSIRAVLIHRNNKKEKYVHSTLEKSNRFIFKVDFNTIVNSKNDFGVWDLFIESEVEGYRIRSRFGNSRNPSFDPKDFITYYGEVDFTVKPYFTKPYDNLSFDVVKKTKIMKDSGVDPVSISQKVHIRYWKTINTLKKVKKHLKRLIYFRTR